MMTLLEEQLERERNQALAELESIQSAQELEAWRVAHLGKASPVMQAFAGLGKLPAEERPLIGKAANAVKQA
jgi:phenylalanyl-tRNA synthetase alpha chain